MEKNIFRLFKALLFLGLLAGAILFLTSIGSLVKILIISALLAYIIDPLAVFLESRGMSRSWAAAVIFLAVILIVSVCLFFFLPVVSREIMAIKDGMSSGQNTEIIARIEDTLEKKLAFLDVGDLDLAKKINDLMVNIGHWTFNHLLDIVSLITNLVIIPFIVFFLLKDSREIKKGLIGIVPNRYFEFSLNLLYKMDLQLGNYLRGQFLDATIFGILSVLALWILKVKYFFLIGIFAGLANLIPFIGPIAGVAPAVIVSVLDTGDFTASLYIMLAFALLKLIDDVLIQPVVVARSVKMHPLLVLLAVIIGGKFFGILGMLLSVPAAGFIKVVLQESILIFRRYHLT